LSDYFDLFSFLLGLLVLPFCVCLTCTEDFQVLSAFCQQARSQLPLSCVGLHDCKMLVMVTARHLQGPAFVVIFITVKLLHMKEVLINKKLDWWNNY